MLTKETSDIDLNSQTIWIVAVDENSCDDIFKMISLVNEQDFECEVYGLLFQENEDIKTWAENQGIKINCVISEDKEIQEKLGIKAFPWFVCIEKAKVVYSSEDIPTDLNNIKRIGDYIEDLIELKSPEKLTGGKISPIRNKVSDSLFKVSTELPNTSLLINKSADTELEKALKKIDKQKLKLKKQEQTIEDYKAEVKQLRALLSAKFPEAEPKFTPEQKQKMLSKKNSNGNVEPLQRNIFSNKMQNKFKPRLDENEFWKIDDHDEMQESIKFEDIAASKDLWLMGLFKAQKEPSHIPKPSKILPPIQLDKQKVQKTMKRESSLIKSDKRALSNNPPTISSKRLRKNI